MISIVEKPIWQGGRDALVENWGAIQGARAYDSEADRKTLRQKGITLIPAKHRTDNSSGLGIFRWMVERTRSRLIAFEKRKRKLYEKNN
ncbi:MAG TPA: hypothetical protein PLP49_01720 [Anaerohalosphaeraceae bacterium]|nr:hypothetical protein [Anaerohalosphaeraceae bacterium]HPB92931.1 hypothetical protein [Anaerohalosphaeraceae bacterium]